MGKFAYGYASYVHEKPRTRTNAAAIRDALLALVKSTSPSKITMTGPARRANDRSEFDHVAFSMTGIFRAAFRSRNPNTRMCRSKS